jgi:hypothetical protein
MVESKTTIQVGWSSFNRLSGVSENLKILLCTGGRVLQGLQVKIRYCAMSMIETDNGKDDTHPIHIYFMQSHHKFC